VLPSYSEGMSVATLEAMASGLPVVVTKTAGTDELVEEGFNGFTFSYGDVMDLSNIIINLYNNRGLIDRMGINSRRKVQSFKWEFTVEKYVNLFFYLNGINDNQKIGNDLLN
jgi:glycosyltransferase involved in cell wall biosynthesis